MLAIRCRALAASACLLLLPRSHLTKSSLKNPRRLGYLYRTNAFYRLSAVTPSQLQVSMSLQESDSSLTTLTDTLIGSPTKDRTTRSVSPKEEVMSDSIEAKIQRYLSSTSSSGSRKSVLSDTPQVAGTNRTKSASSTAFPPQYAAGLTKMPINEDSDEQETSQLTKPAPSSSSRVYEPTSDYECEVPQMAAGSDRNDTTQHYAA